MLFLGTDVGIASSLIIKKTNRRGKVDIRSAVGKGVIICEALPSENVHAQLRGLSALGTLGL